MGDLTSRLRARLEAPIDIASLAAFRILFGLLMCGAAVRVLLRGWVQSLYLAPAFHFTWGPFWFVRPWPGIGMYAHFLALALAALGIALGFCTRLCAAIFFVGFAYVELIDKALYLNHYYLITLLAGLLIVLPAGRAFSLDVVRSPPRKARQIPAWVLGVLRLQMGVVYLFAGLAKVNGDWLLHAQPLRLWLSARSDWPLVGPLLAQPALAFVASWTGMVFDLSLVGWLLWKPTRVIAFAAAVLFHVGTGVLFPIGMFPWLMIAGATVFLAPDWPRRFVGVVAGGVESPGGHLIVPGRLVTRGLAVHALLQLALPLRPYLASGNCGWTGRGFNFSWNVMIVEKQGTVELALVDPIDGHRIAVTPARWLTPLQIEAMAQDPEMIAAFARHVAGVLGCPLGHPLAVHVSAFVSLNGRAPRRLLDEAIDLSAPDVRIAVLPRE